jgi:ABC-2 type transport system permease protein
MSESVIHDIGYQRYDGPRLGRGYALRSLYTQGVRTVFAFGRTGKAKIFPWAVAGIVYLVAIILTAIRSQGATLSVTYWNFANAVWILIALFCAVVAPELVSRDIRGTVLPLYFSRPLTRADYAIAKLLAMMTAVFIMLVGPETVMLLGGVFTVDGFGNVMAEVGHWTQGLAVAAVYAAIFGGLSILIASLSGRRGVASALIAAMFLVTFAIVGIVVGLTAAHAASTGQDPAAAANAAVQWAGVISPVSLADGLANWWFGGHPVPTDSGSGGPPDSIGSWGPLYAVVAIPFVAACVGLLLLRYWKVAR